VLDEESKFNLGKIHLAYVQAKRAAEELVLTGVLPHLSGGDGGGEGKIFDGDNPLTTSSPNPLSAAKRGSKTHDVVVVNPGYLIGPEDFDRSVMGQLCHRFWRGRAPIAPPGGLNVVDVRDAAIGHLLAAERGVSGRRYILGGENLDYPAFFRAMADVAGFRPRWIPHISRPIFMAAAALNELRGRLRGKEPYPSLAHARLNGYYWFVSSERAQRELGYAPRCVRDSLTDAYAWYASRERFRVRGFNRWLLRPMSPDR
jgi:dihydroflavonol-4-reductase